MLINNIHIFVKFLKNQGQNIYHTPEQIDDAINRAALDLFRQEEKIFEAQQIITDTLGAMKVRLAFTNDVSGVYSLPLDYVRATNLAFDIDSITETLILTPETFTFCDPTFTETTSSTLLSNLEHPIDLLVDSDWINRQKSKFLPPEESNPIARIFGRSLQILPKTITPILYYLKTPTKAKFAFTVSGDGFSTIFDAANSIDLDFPEISHNEIVEKTISLLGISVRDNILTQFEQIQKRNNNE